VADIYTPTSHSDGELLDKDDLNNLENGLGTATTQLDQVSDQVTALVAGGGSSRQVLSGPFPPQESPAIGLPFFATNLTPPRVVWGNGTSWVNSDGTAVNDSPGGGGGGGTTAPQNMRATVTAGGTIGAIVLDWDAVPGATSYKLYETQSPNGVNGATALTTTTSTRTPSTPRIYDYWVTATVNGVESPASNHVQATLPYVAPGGGGGGSPSGMPSELLNINGLGNGQGGWWNLGVGKSSGHVDIDPNALKTYAESPYYELGSTGTEVAFQVFMNGGKTSPNTKYPRCELREYATGSTTVKAAWNAATGRHIMRGRTKVIHYAPIKCEDCIAQIHDESDDNLQIRAEASSATGAQTWRLSINGTKVKDLISGVALGQEVFWGIDLNNGVLTTSINGSVVDTRTPGYTSKSSYYFKVGNYAQQNSTDQANPTTEYSRSTLRDLFVSHS
jgi:hypothetical protein